MCKKRFVCLSIRSITGGWEVGHCAWVVQVHPVDLMIRINVRRRPGGAGGGGGGGNSGQRPGDEDVLTHQNQVSNARPNVKKGLTLESTSNASNTNLLVLECKEENHLGLWVSAEGGEAAQVSGQGAQRGGASLVLPQHDADGLVERCIMATIPVEGVTHCRQPLPPANSGPHPTALHPSFCDQDDPWRVSGWVGGEGRGGGGGGGGETGTFLLQHKATCNLTITTLQCRCVRHNVAQSAGTPKPGKHD